MSVAQNAVTGGRFGGSTVWNAYLADCYETHERSLYFGYFTGVWMLAITFAPLMPVYIVSTQAIHRAVACGSARTVAADTVVLFSFISFL